MVVVGELKEMAEKDSSESIDSLRTDVMDISKSIPTTQKARLILLQAKVYIRRHVS